jgi:hypothetical protein
MDRVPLNIYDTEVRRYRRGLGYAQTLGPPSTR